MNLKKSDKIIAIIGVIILIIAAISIIYYVYEEDKTDDNEKSEEKEFTVTWMKKTGEMEFGEMVEEETFTSSFIINKNSGCVITDVSIRLTWEDEEVYGGLRGRIPSLVKGADSLDAKITLENDIPRTHNSTGEGNETFNFAVNSMPDLDAIMANDTNDAMNKLTERYKDMNSAKFDYEITVTTGEKFRILRPLSSLLKLRSDTGDEFSLEVTYEYYEPTAMEKTDNNDNYTSTGEDDYTGTATYNTMGLKGGLL